MLPQNNTFPLPTLPSLGVDPATLSADLDTKPIIEKWFSAFKDALLKADIDDIMNLFINDAYWRDILALTWNIRTFAGKAKISQFLKDRLRSAKLTNWELTHQEYTKFTQIPPDLCWVQFFVKFDVGDVGAGTGVIRLVPVATASKELDWKAHVIFTTLETLKDFPERIGNARQDQGHSTRWKQERAEEINFEQKDPTVLVVGGSQSGLVTAARLKYLDISCLAIEKGDKIGGNWIDRYETLRVHDPVWRDHLPYLPFPPTWPVYSPAKKLANWLQYYADILDLNVWTSSTVTKAQYDPNTNLWTVTVVRRATSANGLKADTERVFTVKHVVFATGVLPEQIEIPSYPGLDRFKGEIQHAFRYKTAADFVGRKVVVVGSGESAHDICADCYHHGIDVTMYQRGPTYVVSADSLMKVFHAELYSEGSPPTDIADMITASTPYALVYQLSKRGTKFMAETLDKDLIDGLNKRGFKTNLGIEDAGGFFLVMERGGGVHIDVGSSQLIIDGKIKLKSGTMIQEFTEIGIKFEDASELQADAVIFATGRRVSDLGNEMRRICGPEAASKIGPVWGFDEEWEIHGLWRDVGMPGLWCMKGNLAMVRHFSKYLALQIKAMEEGLFGTRY